MRQDIVSTTDGRQVLFAHDVEGGRHRYWIDGDLVASPPRLNGGVWIFPVVRSVPGGRGVEVIHIAELELGGFDLPDDGGVVVLPAE